MADPAYPDETVSVSYRARAGGVQWELRATTGDLDPDKEPVASGWCFDRPTARQTAFAHFGDAVRWLTGIEPGTEQT